MLRLNNMDWKKFLPVLCFGDESELFFEESYGLVVSYEDGKVDEIESGQSRGISLRYLLGEETRFGHVNGQESERILKLSNDISKGLNRFQIPKWDGIISKNQHQIVKEPSKITLDEKIGILEVANKTCRLCKGSEQIRQVSLTYAERIKNITCISVLADGVHAFSEERVYTSVAVSVVAEKNGILQTATEVVGALTGFELMSQQTPVTIARIATERALKKLEAPSAPVGEMAVILHSEAGGTMIHEAIGHSLEADGIQKGISPAFAGKIGTIVANEKITVYDDPTFPQRRGSFIYDDEGTKSEKTILVENGVLKNYLYDKLTARKDNRSSNGHGRRESYAHKPIPRMSNTMIAPGPDDLQMILQSVENGLLVKRMGGGQVNPVTSDFVFEIEEGYLIENGKIKTLVRGASLLGNGPQVLKSIDLVGSDLGWGVGTCGKDGQGVPVSDAQPTLRIPKLLIGGS